MKESSIQLGDAVSIDSNENDDGDFIGFVQYFNDEVVGVRLMGKSMGQGDSDGSFQGTRYFACRPQDAIFVDPSRITKRYMSRVEELKMKRELAASIHLAQKLNTRKYKVKEKGNAIESRVEAKILRDDSRASPNVTEEEREASEKRDQEIKTMKDNNHLLQVALGTKQQEIDKLRKACTKAELEKSEAVANAAAFEENNTFLKACLKDLESKHDKEIRKVEKSFEESKAANTELQNRVDELEEKTKLEARKLAIQKSVSGWEERTKEEKSSINIGNLNSELNNRISELDAQHLTIQKSVSSWEAELEKAELAAHAAGLEESNAELKSSVKELESKHSKEMKKLEKSFKESKDLNAKLQHRMSELVETRSMETAKLIKTSVSEIISGLEFVHEQLEDRTEETKKERRVEMEKLKSELFDCISGQNQLLEQLMIDDKELQQEKEMVPSSDQEGLGKMVHFEKPHENHQIDMQKISMLSQSTPLTDQADQCDHLKKSLAAAEAKAKQLQKRADLFEQQNGKLEDRIARLRILNQQHEEGRKEEQKDVDDLRRCLSQSRTRSRELKEKITKVEEENRMHAEKYKQALVKWQAVQTKFKKQVEKLEQENLKLQNYVRNQQDFLRKEAEEKQTQALKFEQAFLNSKTTQTKLIKRAETLEQQNQKLRDYIRRKQQESKQDFKGITVQ